MHASSPSRPYAATHTSAITTAHTFDRPTTSAYSSPLALPIFLRFNPPSKLYLRLREYHQSAARTRSPSAHPYPAHSFTPRADSAPPSVLLLAPSPLRHAIAIHLIRISATSLTGSIPAPYHSTRPVPDVREHIVAVVASLRFCARCGLPHGRRSRLVSVLQYPMLLARSKYVDFPFLPFRSFAFLPRH
jgi:hypothetical protein